MGLTGMSNPLDEIAVAAIGPEIGSVAHDYCELRDRCDAGDADAWADRNLSGRFSQ